MTHRELETAETAEVAQGWQAADLALAAWRQRRATADAELLRWLALAERAGAHRALGFGTFYDYVRARLGLGRTLAYEWVRMSRALAGLPALHAALATGRLTFCAVRELSRVVTAKNEQAWLAAAEGQPIRVLEELVHGRGKGDLPTTPRREAATILTRTFELSSATVALMAQVKLLVENDQDTPLSDDEFLAEILRARLEALREGRRTNTIKAEVIIKTCPACESSQQLAAGRWLEVDNSVFDRLDFGDTFEFPHVGTVFPTQEPPEELRRAVYIRDQGRCRVPGCSSTHALELHHVIPREAGGPHALFNCLLLCGAHHRAHHGGRLLVVGPHAYNLRFLHPDGTPCGAEPVGRR